MSRWNVEIHTLVDKPDLMLVVNSRVVDAGTDTKQVRPLNTWFWLVLRLRPLPECKAPEQISRLGSVNLIEKYQHG